MDKIARGREFRGAFEVETKGDYIVEGYATTFDKPYVLFEYDGVKYYEVVDRNAFNGADMSDVIFQYDHQGKVYARISNETLSLKVDSHGLYIRADLSKTETSRQMYEEIESGLVTRMSFAFTVSQQEFNRDTRTRTIQSIKKVFDVSAVSIPANPDTEISARSFIDGVIEKEKQELLEQEMKKRKLMLLLEL
ncbi:hypothetical protein AOC36_09565 [Erysipelothrix larvae]|uniref:Prohead serine protease domain-containing protein n=2 Tax=Erysipelothrix larvae TaxID=1514105 RepID=A0A0X8H2I3_9FIRM|nr:hypothetical protein AOC36_09565 [Erysipelothrix larvae]